PRAPGPRRALGTSARPPPAPRAEPAAAQGVVPAPAAPTDAAQTYVAGSSGSGLSLPAGKRVSLAFLTGPRAGEVYVLQHPTALIGRQGGGGGAHIELQDTEVSRTHAVLECHGSRFVGRDLQSTNGTLVPRQP